EAHHVLPASWEPNAMQLPKHMDRMLFITLENPDLVAPAALACVSTVLVTGKEPHLTLGRFAAADHVDMLPHQIDHLEPGQAILWSQKKPTPTVIKVEPGKVERRRQSRKNAEGAL